jgi:hypothetical protein
MEVKGTGILATRSFIEKEFPNQYQHFVHQLPLGSKKIYTDLIKTSAWYPIEDAYYYPTKIIADLFYDGDEKKAGEFAGRYSADFALKGIYKVFLLVASPQSLMKAAKRIISLYYKPVDVSITEIETNSLVLTTTKLHSGSSILDYRTAGWCQRALELANCKNVKYRFVTTNKENEYAIKLYWD